MADRVSASIAIGGKLTATDYIELATIIAEEGLSTEWDGEAFEPEHRTIAQPLNLFAHEVAGGCFEELEAWCIAKRLPFTRWSGGYAGQWGAERVVFTGEGGPNSYAADEDDEVVLDRSTAEKLRSFEAIIAHFDAANWVGPPLTVDGDLEVPDEIRSMEDAAAAAMPSVVAS